MQTSMEEWINKIGETPIPVMAHTISELIALCKEDVPIQDIVELVETDPGLTVQLIRTCSTSSHGSLRTEVTSAQQALMMLGIQKLKKLPDTLPALEKKLSQSARQHLLKTFSCAYHAARQATLWAKLRRDMMPDEVFAASLLHFLGEMVLSIYAPELLDKIEKMRVEDHIASEEAQYIVLGFTHDQLSLEIAQRWNMPPLVIEALHAENAQHPRAYSIMLAVQLARHATLDWYSRKTFHLQEEAAKWLDQPLGKLIKDTHQLAIEVAHESGFYNINPAAARLLCDPVIPSDDGARDEQGDQTNQHHAGICLIPQLSILKDVIDKLKAVPASSHDVQAVINMAVQGLHDGIGLNRVVFALYRKNENIFSSYSISGADNDPVFGQFKIGLDQKNLFSHFVSKTQALWLHDENRDKYWPGISNQFKELISTDEFYVMSIGIDDKLSGIFYADRHTSDCQLDSRSYKFFKGLCAKTEETLRRMEKLHIN